MYIEELVTKSFNIAIKAHRGQYRRDGITPYIEHPKAVALNFNDPILKSIALLHDVMEDGDITVLDLAEQGISGKIINAVVILTKKRDEKYLDYILRIKNNPFATLVKIEDIKHNYPTTHKSKQERYDMALYILKGEKDE